MNQAQTKYTMERVRVLEVQKLAALREEYTVQAKLLTDAEIAALVKAGTVKMKKGLSRTRSSHYFCVDDLYDLSAHQWTQHLREGFAEAEAAIKAQAAKVKDEIMLGDNAAALALLREFAGE